MVPDPIADSHYLGVIEPGVTEREQLCCVAITPTGDEKLPWKPPGEFKLLPDGPALAKALRDAIGPVRFTGADGLAAGVCKSLNEGWTAVGSGDRPMRIMVKHYPRPDLPGRCMTVLASFYTVPDPIYEIESFYKGRTVKLLPGLIFEIRKTYQLEGGPRLVDAGVQVHTGVGNSSFRTPVGSLLGLDFVDDNENVHFEQLGDGEQRGLYWIDRSAGLGKADPWTRAYVSRKPGEVEQGDLTPDVIEALLDLARRL